MTLRITTPEIALKIQPIEYALSVVKKATYGTNVKKIVKRCLNCDEEHSTLAMKCPKRKMIMKVKRKQEAERQNMTYSDMTRVQINISSQAKPPQYNAPQITREELLKINICISHAHHKNLIDPGI